MIADSHVNGDARNTNWLNKFEKLFVLGFFTIAQSAVAVDDQVSGSRMKCDDALGHLCKALCHVHAFMLVLRDGRSRPLRPRVDKIRIGTDVCIGK